MYPFLFFVFCFFGLFLEFIIINGCFLFFGFLSLFQLLFFFDFQAYLNEL